MGVKNPRTMDSLKEEWKNGHGRYPNIIEQAFGEVNHNLFLAKERSFHDFIDSVFPDYFPFNMVQGFLQTAIDQLYDREAFNHYDQGCYEGNQITGKIEETINWAKGQITNEVDGAKAYIKSNLIDPIQNTIDNNLKPAIKNAQDHVDYIMNQINGFNSKIAAMGNSVDGFQSSLNDFQSRIDKFNSTLNDLQSKISDFDNKIYALSTKVSYASNKVIQFDNQLNDLTSKAQSLDTALQDAQDRLSQYKTLIDDLGTRVSALESKTGFPFFDTKKFMEKL